MEGKKCCGLALGLTFGIIWAGALLFVGVFNRFCSPYGYEFLKMVDSIYPGYVAGAGLKNLSIGVLWAFFDGLIGGIVIAWLYNFISKCRCKCKTEN